MSTIILSSPPHTLQRHRLAALLLLPPLLLIAFLSSNSAQPPLSLAAAPPLPSSLNDIVTDKLQVAHTQAQLELIESRLNHLRAKIASMDDNDHDKYRFIDQERALNIQALDVLKQQARVLRSKSELYSAREDAALANYTHGLTAQVINQGSKDAEKFGALAVKFAKKTNKIEGKIHGLGRLIRQEKRQSDLLRPDPEDDTHVLGLEQRMNTRLLRKLKLKLTHRQQQESRDELRLKRSAGGGDAFARDMVLVDKAVHDRKKVELSDAAAARSSSTPADRRHVALASPFSKEENLAIHEGDYEHEQVMQKAPWDM